MLVRLKKRGRLNPHGRPNLGHPSTLWYGRIIEVEPSPCASPYCDAEYFNVTDSRLVPQGTIGTICAHAFIDDLDAYESDSADEQAEVGDIAFANLPVKVGTR